MNCFKLVKYGYDDFSRDFVSKLKRYDFFNSNDCVYKYKMMAFAFFIKPMFDIKNFSSGKVFLYFYGDSSYYFSIKRLNGENWNYIGEVFLFSFEEFVTFLVYKDLRRFVDEDIFVIYDKEYEEVFIQVSLDLYWQKCCNFNGLDKIKRILGG